MAIRDLLWACPACGEANGLVPTRRDEACRACGAVVRRGRGATIIVAAPGRAPITRNAWEWCDALPNHASHQPVALEGRAILREATAAWPLHEDQELLGFVEKFGDKVPGTVRLTPAEVRFTADENGAERIWPLLDMTAVQPASSALQLKLRDHPVVTLKFVDCSVRLWEQRVQEALRRAFRAAGRGEIVEFQPRVSFR